MKPSPRLALRARTLAIGALATLATACAPPGRPDEGFITVEGGRVWYHRVGAGTTGTPLLLLHGGPGSCSYGLKPFLALATERPVILYDQLGCGKSDRPTDTSLFTVDRYVRELQSVRDSLGLREIHLLGQSWGGMLAEAYMGTQPSGVKSLILASPLVTTAQWEHDADSMVKELPAAVRAAIAKHEADHTTDAPEYVAATVAYYRLHLTRQPIRDRADADSSNKGFGKLVYEYMWGPSEFTSTGTLKHFDATAWLQTVKVPTLFIAGEYDEATPASTKRFAQLVPGAEFVMIPGSGHVTQNDNRDSVFAAVRGFIARVEKR